MFDFINDSYVPLIIGALFVVAIILCFVFTATAKQGERLITREIRRRQAAEHEVQELKKQLDQVTRVLARQRLICNNCPNCNPGGDDK